MKLPIVSRVFKQKSSQAQQLYAIQRIRLPAKQPRHVQCVIAILPILCSVGMPQAIFAAYNFMLTKIRLPAKLQCVTGILSSRYASSNILLLNHFFKFLPCLLFNAMKTYRRFNLTIKKKKKKNKYVS